MKVLYAIQGTGNGHISRAREIVPILKEKCELDLLISGIQADVKLSQETKYNFKGLSFIFGKKGGVDIWNTYMKNKFRRFQKELKQCPVEDYDLVINDFEPISAWAAYRKKVPCIALSHQAAVLHKKAPKPDESDRFGKFILKNYAPASTKYGFHFERFGDRIYTPVIRSEVRNLKIKNKGHYTVYLPAYDDERLLKKLGKFKGIKWQVFSKHNKIPIEEGNIQIMPINNEAFIKSMAESEGVLCGAGFETPAEALYLQKKLLVIPMKTQYEQQCNAAALNRIGVPSVKSLKKKHFDTIYEWLESTHKVAVDYPDEVSDILDHVLSKHANDHEKGDQLWKKEFDLEP